MSVKDWIWVNKKICKTFNNYFNMKIFSMSTIILFRNSINNGIFTLTSRHS